MKDLTDLLSTARPTDHELDDVFGPAARRDVLDRVLASGRQPATRATRRRVVGLAAALLLVGASVPTAAVLAGSAAASRDLRALARAAGDQPILSDGGYLHVRTTSVQIDTGPSGDKATMVTHRESWVRRDGTTWAIDSRPAEGWREYLIFPRNPEPYLNVPTPEFAASLPTDRHELRRYLDEHVSGSTSHNEAIFVAVSDLARSHFLPPATLRAALEILADVDGVKTRRITVDDRAAVEISFSRFPVWVSARDSMVLDLATAQVISERRTYPDLTYSADTVLLERVDQIPEDVRAQFKKHAGQRVTGS